MIRPSSRVPVIFALIGLTTGTASPASPDQIATRHTRGKVVLRVAPDPKS